MVYTMRRAIPLQSLEEFLVAVVRMVVQPCGAEVTLMQLCNGQKTSDLLRSVTSIVHSETGLRVRS